MAALDKYSTTPVKYKDYLRQQAQDTLKELKPPSVSIPTNIESLTPDIPPQRQQQQGQQDPNNIMGSMQSMYGAISGTQGRLLDKPAPVTQGFGNYNPNIEKFSGGVNSGLDLGAPVGTRAAVPPGRWQVVEAYDKDSSPGFVGNNSNSGYGNSVLVQNLDTGEKLRYSHLSQVGAQPGQQLEGGSIVGLTGATGNVTGPHLDLEYYDHQGRLSNVMKSQYSSYINSQGDGYGGEGGGNPLAALQRFVESPKPVQVPGVQPFSNSSLKGKAGNAAANLPGALFNGIVGPGVIDPSLDMGRMLGHTMTRTPLPAYDQLKSGATKLGYQLGSIPNADTRSQYGIPENPLAYAGNVAKTAAPIVEAQGIRTGAFTIADLKNALKALFTKPNRRDFYAVTDMRKAMGVPETGTTHY